MRAREEKHLQDKSQQNLRVTPEDSRWEAREEEEEERVSVGAETVIIWLFYLFA